MSIPDYMITRTVLEEHMHKQFQETPDQPRHEPTDPPRTGRLIMVRKRLSAALQAAAAAIEPSSPAPSGPRA